MTVISPLIFKQILMVTEMPRTTIKKKLINRYSIFGFLSKQALRELDRVEEGALETVILDLRTQIK